jgi:AraC-like DNA-binding protein
VYQGKKEIEKAKEYIENNWLEKFVLKDVLSASGLSKTHFTRLFKKHTGTTAHEFYIRVKIGKLKEKLIDPNIGVIQAFTECNLEYSGRFAKIFKDREGVTPSEYKQMNSER